MSITAVLQPQIGLIFFQTIVMIGVYCVLKKLAWKPLLSFIKKEEEAYTQAVAQIKKGEEMKDKLQQESNAIVEEANKRKEAIIAKALAMKETFLAQAQQEALKQKKALLKQARQQIEEREAASLLKVKREAAGLVVHATQKLLAMELTQKHTQQLLLQRLIEEAATQKSIAR